VARPRILLCPQFTEVEWVIAPELEQWAEVATFDSPGVGGQPMPGGDIRKLTREVIADRGLEEVDSRGWNAILRRRRCPRHGNRGATGAKAS